MTFTEFVLYAVEYDRQHHKERSGQSVFNALSTQRRDLADQIEGGNLDPFYDDTVLSAFWTWLGGAW